MVYIDWQLSLIADFFLLFSTLLLHRYFLRTFNIKYFLSDIAISLIFGYIGLFFDDFFILMFICLMLLINWLSSKPHQLDMAKSISLITAASIEIVLFSFATYSARILFFIANNEWKLRILEQLQQNFIAVSLIINVLYLIIFLLVASNFKPQTVKLWIQIEQYHLGKRVFQMALGSFLAFMIILIISDFQSVTATIQAVLLLIFSIGLVITYRQLIFFIRTIAIQNEAKEKILYNKQLNEYLTTVQQQYTDLRKFKHDFQNIMLSMKPFVDNSNSTELKNYYHDILKERVEMSKVSGGNITEVRNIDSDAIRGLLIQKFFIARSEQIQFNLELNQTHYHFDNDILILVRILGILIDNALEYVQTIDEKIVTCAITQTDNTTEITIDNPLKNKLNLKAIFQSDYTTKDQHTGFGLANARKLISETDNLYLETKIIHEHIMMTLIIVGGE
jgi:Signal transduction histidine kinase regulating citrate/malate metabolism